MNNRRPLFFLLLIAQGLLFSACTTKTPADYTAFAQARPRSVLVLPPINNTTEIQAGNSMLSWSSISLGEMGYYVLPVALTNETFRHNGITEPEEAHALPLARLRKIFGADAVVYITVEDFGTTFVVVSSVTQVRAKARLVDARSGTELWQGEAEVSSGSQGSGSLAAILITAVVDQIVNTTVDRAHTQVAPVVSGQLFVAEKYGVYPGPYASEEKWARVGGHPGRPDTRNPAAGHGPAADAGAEPKASAPAAP